MEPESLLKKLETKPISHDLMAQITPTAYDASGAFMTPIKTGLKVLLLRICDVTGPNENDCDLSGIDKELAGDIKAIIKELINLKFTKISRAIIPKLNTLTSFNVSYDGFVFVISTTIDAISTNEKE